MSLATLKAKVEQLIVKAQNSGEDTLDKYLTQSITHIRNENAVEFFQNYMLARQPNLVSIDFPNLVRTYDYLCAGCTKLENVSLPKANYVGTCSFEDCTSLKYISQPSAATFYNHSFRRATKLKTVDIGVTTNFARSGVFSGATSFDTLILRGNEVSTLSNIDNFDGGAFASGTSGGTIYVPSALIESYKTATNWSALYNAGRCNFVAIEGSEYE